ncbi:hypothetical protein [Kitasatospora sp. NPDC048538]|uniref:hypothetical protein n=1 Tax=unclassified Kitasatospora TaxID=2633591 RepID=UPI0033D1792E
MHHHIDHYDSDGTVNGGRGRCGDVAPAFTESPSAVPGSPGAVPGVPAKPGSAPAVPVPTAPAVPGAPTVPGAPKR